MNNTGVVIPDPGAAIPDPGAAIPDPGPFKAFNPRYHIPRYDPETTRNVETTRMCAICRKIKNARAKRAKLLFFVVKYANL